MSLSTLRLNIVKCDPYFGFPLDDNEYALDFYKSLHDKGFKCLDKYVGSKTMMNALCPFNHPVHGYPKKLTIPCNNCPTCWDNRKLTSAQRLQEVVIAHKGQQLTPYVLSKNDIQFKCYYDHPFVSNWNYVSSGRWCTVCAGNNVDEAKKKFYSILEANGAKALTPYINSITPVDILCKYQHTYSQVPSSTNMGYGCKFCAGNAKEQGEQRFHEMVAAKGGKVLGKYINNHTKVPTLCKNRHIFQAIPHAVTSGGWCSKCSHRCPEQAKENFIRSVTSQGGIVIGEYTNFHNKVALKCQWDHPFEMDPCHLARGQWCPKCRNHCPEQAKERFEEVVKVQKGTIIGTYVNTYTKVAVKCEKSHPFEIKPNNATNGKWCRICGLGESKGEKAVRLCLESLDIPFQAEKTFDWMPRKRFDFYFTYNNRNYLVEFDGIQHFVQIEFFHPTEELFRQRQQVDIDKTVNSLNAGNFLIRIAHEDIDNVPDIIEGCINNPNPPARLYLSDMEEYKWLMEGIRTKIK